MGNNKEKRIKVHFCKKNMERKAIAIQGISTGSDYTDGACINMVNVRHEQGVLKPVESFNTNMTLKTIYSIIYRHKNNDYNNLIGVRSGGLYWIKNAGEEGEEEILLLSLSGTSVILSHIGNIINVLDGNILKYIMWKNTSYYEINIDFDGSQTDSILGLVKVDLKVDGYSEGGVRKSLNFYSESNVGVGSPYDDKQKMASGLMYKAKAYDESEGRLTGFVMACTAIELYDGSYIVNSNTILLGQSYDERSRYKSANISGHDYIENPALYYSAIRDTDNSAVSWEIITSNTERFYEKTNNFIRSGTSLNDNELTTYFPNIFCSSYWLKIDGGDLVKRMVCRKSANVLKMRIRNNISEEYKSLVKSISIFISPEILAQDYDTVEYKGYFDHNGNTENRSENYFAKPKTDKDIIKELTSITSFYKVKEIKFEDIVSGDWIDLSEDLKDKLGDNLLLQPRLTTESYSKIKVGGQMVYNSMLHVWDVKNVLSRGYPLNYYYAQQGIGQFAGVEDWTTHGWFWWIEVSIESDSGVSKVVRYKPYSGSEALQLSKLTPMLAFPDSRAYKMTIFMYDVYSWESGFGYTYKKEYPLKAHESGSFAYYIDPELKPIVSSLSLTSGSESNKQVPAEENTEESSKNKLKVSKTNNPFIFPDTQTYQAGDGEIMNVSSQSIRVSDGQFGAYPVVCFCSDGEFPLEVGSDGSVAYSRVGTVQNYERTISKVLCTTPYGIAFISPRGLCMLSGQEILFLSESVFEKFRSIELEIPTELSGLFTIDFSDFNDYLEGCKTILYNAREKELILVNTSKSYNYVYNILTKQFYKNTELIEDEIINSLPDIQVWHGNSIKEVTNSGGGNRYIEFVTRPIKMQTPDYKNIERLILRSMLKNISGTNAVACLWGSIDDKNYKLLRGMVLSDGISMKDIDFGMFGSSTYRSYILGLSMTVSTESEIEAIEMEVEKLYNDTKMR